MGKISLWKSHLNPKSFDELTSTIKGGQKKKKSWASGPLMTSPTVCSERLP